MELARSYYRSFLLMTCLVLCSAISVGFAPVFAQTGSATSSATPSDAAPDIGAQIQVDIHIDVSAVDPPDENLGSYTGTLDWNPAVLVYNSYSGAPPVGFTGVVNTDNVSSGEIAFNGANASGAPGETTVLEITFDVVGSGTSALDLEYSAMAAATTFEDLLPILTVNDGQVDVSLPQYTLTMAVSPSGGGSTTPAVGDHDYDSGTVVDITATPADGYVFDSWTGDVADPGEASTTVTVDGDKTVTATFTEQVAGAVTLDGAVSTGTTTASASSVSFSHTTGTGTDRLLLVGVSWNCGSTSRSISSVTFTYGSGTVLNLSQKIVQETLSTTKRFAAIWYSPTEPPLNTSGTVKVTFSGNVTNGIAAGAANFAGVDQTTPLGPSNGANSSSTGTTQSVTLNSLSGNELVFDTVFIGGTTDPTVDPSQSQLWTANGMQARGVASTEQATSSNPVEMSWTTTSAVVWASAAVAINPGVTGPTHDLTMAVDPTEGGTTTPTEGVHTYAEDAEVDITATPADGYEFDYWEGDVDDPDAASTTVIMDEDQEVTAHFAQIEYTLTITIVGSGTVSKDPDQTTYHYNDVVELEATANTGWIFTGWSDDLESTTNPDNITINGNKTVTATFVPEYTLTVGDDGHGTVTLDPAGGTYASGTTVTLTPVPNLGYKFDSWTGDDADDVVESGGVYTIVMDADKSVSATFSEVTLYVDGVVSSGTDHDVNTISISHTTGTGTNRLMLVAVVTNNYTTTFTIDEVTFTYGSPETELELTEVGTGTDGGRTSAIYQLLNPPSGQSGTVTVNFSATITYSIVVGAANFAGVDQTTPLGTFDSATGNWSGGDASLEMTDLDGDELVFDSLFGGGQNSPTLTVGPGQSELWNVQGDESLSGGSSTEQATGSSVTMSWTSDITSGVWILAAVPINPAPTGTTYDLTMAVDPTEGGTTTPTEGVHTYAEDAEVDITATPADGYSFDHWSGALSGSVNPTSITMDGDKGVTAHFTQIEYTLTITIVGNGTVSKDPDQTTYHYNDVVELEATANTGWIFTGWSGDLVSTDTPDEITIDGHKTVTATFVEMEPETVYLDGPIAYDVMESGSTVSMDISTGIGENRLMLVGVSYNSSSTGSAGSRPYISSVTFTPDGESAIGLDLVRQQWSPPSETVDPGRMAAIYVLDPSENPAAGTEGILAVSFSASFTTGAVVGVANFQGVDQTDPLGEPNSAATTNSVATVSVEVTTTGNELVFDTIWTGGQPSWTMSAASPQSELWNDGYQNTLGGASIKDAAAGTTTMNWTRSNNGYMSLVAVPINPAPQTYTDTETAEVGTTLHFNEGGGGDPGDGHEVEMTFANLNASGNVTVEQTNSDPSTPPWNLVAGFYLEITADPGISPFSVNIVFHYTDDDVAAIGDENELRLYTSSVGSDWTLVPNQTLDADANTITATGVADFSHFSMAHSGRVANLSPAMAEPNDLDLTWSAVSGAASYNVYRGTTPYFELDRSGGSNRVAEGLTEPNWTDEGATGNPDENYFYVATAVSTTGTEGENSGRVGEFDFQLVYNATNTSVNAIALPLQEDGITMASDLADRITGCDLVSRWSDADQGWISYAPGLPGSDFAISAGHPYWVSVTTSSVWTTVGPISEEITFNLVTTSTTNVNALMLPLEEGDITMASELAADIGVCDLVSVWNDSEQGWESHIPALAFTDFAVKVGCAYMVSVTDNRIWPGATPPLAKIATQGGGQKKLPGNAKTSGNKTSNATILRQER